MSSRIRQDFFELVHYKRLMRTLNYNRAWEMLQIHNAKKKLTQLEQDRNQAYFLPTIIDEEDGQDVFTTPSDAQQIISQANSRLTHINSEIYRLKQLRINAMYKYI